LETLLFVFSHFLKKKKFSQKSDFFEILMLALGEVPMKVRPRVLIASG